VSEHKEIVCPICNSSDFEELTHLPPKAVKCKYCGLGIECSLTADPVNVYKSKNYDNVIRNYGNGGSRWSRFHHDSSVSVKRLEQLSKYISHIQNTPKVWLDVGCSNGAFLSTARRYGWQVRGVEADVDNAKEVMELLGITTIPYSTWMISMLNSNDSPMANCVSLFDVLEHVLDPVSTIIAACNSLKNGGVLVLEVPDFDTASGDFINWKHRRCSNTVTEHIWHFSENSLDTLVKKASQNTRVVGVNRPVPTKLQMVWEKRV